jgi:D-alanyl-D-alanine carboxypeptidase
MSLRRSRILSAPWADLAAGLAPPEHGAWCGAFGLALGLRVAPWLGRTAGKAERSGLRRASATRPLTRLPLLPVLLRSVPLLLLAAPVAAQSTAEAVQSELDGLRDRYGFPGATVAWIAVGGESGGVATGVAEVETGRPMPTDARMLAGSIGKTFVAAALLGLDRDGALELDAPVARWLGGRPWFERIPHGPAITLRHLLTHTSGLRDHVHEPAFQEAWGRRWPAPGPPIPPDSLVGFVLDRPALFEPGEGWAYSDTGYLLLGMVVEAAVGRGVSEEIEARFLEPLGLSATRASDRRVLPGLVPGYVDPGNPFGLPRRTTSSGDTMVWHPGVEGAGGGLVSTALDLARWAWALYRGRALDAPYREELLQARPVDGAGGDTSYGAGVAIRGSGPLGPSWGHAGWIPGYLSSMRYYPDRAVAVAVQVNTDGPFARGAEAGEVLAALEMRLARVIADRLQASGSAPPGEPSRPARAGYGPAPREAVPPPHPLSRRRHVP